MLGVDYENDAFLPHDASLAVAHVVHLPLPFNTQKRFQCSNDCTSSNTIQATSRMTSLPLPQHLRFGSRVLGWWLKEEGREA